MIHIILLLKKVPKVLKLGKRIITSRIIHIHELLKILANGRPASENPPNSGFAGPAAGIPAFGTPALGTPKFGIPNPKPILLPPHNKFGKPHTDISAFTIYMKNISYSYIMYTCLFGYIPINIFLCA